MPSLTISTAPSSLVTSSSSPGGVPTAKLEIAPGSLATDQNPAWVDISDRLKSFTVRRGRQYELDTIQAGTASFEINNADRLLDPGYTAGPFYPNLIPNMQVRLTVMYGTTFSIFRGHIERYPLAYDGPSYSSATLDCVDRQAALAQATIVGSFPEETTGSRILRVLAAAGWPTTTVLSGWTLGTSTLGSTAVLGVATPLNAIDPGRATVAAVTFADSDNQNALTHIQEVAASEPGRFFFDGQGRAVFLDRARYVPAPAASVLTLTDTGSTPGTPNVYYQDVAPSYDIDRIRNDIQLTAEDGTVISATDPVSIDKYWRRTLPIQTHLRSTDSDMRQKAGWLLFTMKDARLRIEQAKVEAFDDNSWTNILGRELGDHLTVLRTPSTGPTVTQESVLEAFELSGSATAGSVWTASLQLSPIVSTSDLWVLGTSRLNTSTRLSYA